MKRIKRAVSLLLAAVMVLSTATTVLAGQGSTYPLDRNGDGIFSFTTLGDSVTAGLGTESRGTGLIGWVKSIYTEKNYLCCPEDSYPYLVSEKLYDMLAESGYLIKNGSFRTMQDYTWEAGAKFPVLTPVGVPSMLGTADGLRFYWSNMGMPGISTAGLAASIRSEVETDLVFMSGQTATYHTLLQQEIARADLLTLAVGSNDLLLGTINKIRTSTNPIINALNSPLMSSFFGGMEAISFDTILAPIQACVASGDYRSIWEAVQILSPSYLRNVFVEEAQSALETFPSVVDAVTDVNGFTGQLVFLGTFNPYGHSLTVTVEKDGKTVTYSWEQMLTEILNSIVQSVQEAAETLSIDAPEAVSMEEVSQKMDAVETGNDSAELLDFPSTIWGNWLDWLKWTEQNINSWITWAPQIWQEWLEIAQRTQASLTAAKALSGEVRHDSISFSAARHFLEQLGVDPALVGSEADVIRFVVDVVRNYHRWSQALAQLKDIGREAQLGILMQALGSVQYPLAYLSVGQLIQSGIDLLNDGVKAYAKASGVPYVDVSGIPNEDNMDPHPLAAGHAYIAQQILDTILLDVNISSSKGIAVSGPEAIIYGDTAVFTVAESSGKRISRVTVNGANAQLQDNHTLVIPHVTTDLDIAVNGVSCVQKPGGICRHFYLFGRCLKCGDLDSTQGSILDRVIPPYRFIPNTAASRSFAKVLKNVLVLCRVVLRH